MDAHATPTLALANGARELRSEPVVTELAQRYGRTAAQIVLRWHIGLG